MIVELEKLDECRSGILASVEYLIKRLHEVKERMDHAHTDEERIKSTAQYKLLDEICWELLKTL